MYDFLKQEVIEGLCLLTISNSEEEDQAPNPNNQPQSTKVVELLRSRSIELRAHETWFTCLFEIPQVYCGFELATQSWKRPDLCLSKNIATEVRACIACSCCILQILSSKVTFVWVID
ncbi:hypothetical protein OUZ56_003634 [Daphnia magna]|uniref:Uncharacterized protein n=1 Tax=Daphnia magna TaxID=35525 RepID=A0ABR0A9A3_9CRUS|nr:hypothetical protein OUZ56_003634 [Daphnia magna]